ncbi:MAG: tetratricopeptide repeat protein [Lentisphaerota bacterium]
MNILFKTAFLCCCAALLLAAAGCGDAGKPQPEDKGDSILSLQEKATGGDTAAMIKLGRVFLTGNEDVEINYAEALKWFEAASAKGSGEAMAHCGLIYNCGGNGVEMDQPKALSCYKASAEKGDSLGQFLYGNILLDGGNLPAALTWLEKSAGQGLLKAQLELGDFYSNNDSASAVKWYKRAADQESPAAMNNLAYLWAEQGAELDKALVWAGKAVSMEPDQATFIDTLGWVLFKKGRYAEAFGRLTEAEKFNPENADILDHLGETCLKLGKKTEADEYWKRAIEQSADQEFKDKIQQKLNSLKK